MVSRRKYALKNIFFCVSWLVLNRLNQKVLAVIGTDTRGSVKVPASYCGILGFRPSHDAISTTGVIPLAQSFDTMGKKQTNLYQESNCILYWNLVEKSSSVHLKVCQMLMIYIFQIGRLFCTEMQQKIVLFTFFPNVSWPHFSPNFVWIMHAPAICVCCMGCECVRACRSDLSFSNDEIIVTMIFCIINKPIAAILFKSRLHQFRLHSSPPPGIEVIITAMNLLFV